MACLNQPAEARLLADLEATRSYQVSADTPRHYGATGRLPLAELLRSRQVPEQPDSCSPKKRPSGRLAEGALLLLEQRLPAVHGIQHRAPLCVRRGGRSIGLGFEGGGQFGGSGLQHFQR